MKSKTVFIATTITLCLIIAGLGYYLYRQQLEFQILVNNYASLQRDYEALEQRHSSLESEYNSLILEYSALQSEYNTLESEYGTLESKYVVLSSEHEILVSEHDALKQRYSLLQQDYASLVTEYQGALKVPYTTIQEGDVVWAFRTFDGTIEKWSLPIETYTYYVDKAKPLEYHYLTTDGDLFTVRKMELFVQPKFFSNVIHDLTDGNTAKDFVREVFNLRVQLTVYSKEITDTPQWSAETMTEGTGDCEDFAILMGSLLVAGNEQANYGMTVQMVYMDSNNPTDPQTVNHVLLYIIYEDETREFVDSTSTDVLSPWSRVVGWYYDL